MLVSVVVRSKDEADRLRLTLTSLAHQSEACEVVVVDDGSIDHTQRVLREATQWLPLVIVSHSSARGRSGASNAGAKAARGEILIFLDGDTLANPELVARHRALHAEAGFVGRGETLHFRGTRFFQDPEGGIPWPGASALLAGVSADALARRRVTRSEIAHDFAALEGRAEPGIYPGAAPRRLNEIEMDALRNSPDCPVLWAASSGCNLSMRRDAFEQVGGFDEGLDNNEHRELALRLCEAGLRMRPVEGARTYHMTHRSGWRDPLVHTQWEARFYAAHPIAAVKLLAVFWASVSEDRHVPPAARISSLTELAKAASGETGIDYDAVRKLFPNLNRLTSTTPA